MGRGVSGECRNWEKEGRVQYCLLVCRITPRKMSIFGQFQHGFFVLEELHNIWCHDGIANYSECLQRKIKIAQVGLHSNLDPVNPNPCKSNHQDQEISLGTKGHAWLHVSSGPVSAPAVCRKHCKLRKCSSTIPQIDDLKGIKSPKLFGESTHPERRQPSLQRTKKWKVSTIKFGVSNVTTATPMQAIEIPENNFVRWIWRRYWGHQFGAKQASDWNGGSRWLGYHTDLPVGSLFSSKMHC